MLHIQNHTERSIQRGTFALAQWTQINIGRKNRDAPKMANRTTISTFSIQLKTNKSFIFSGFLSSEHPMDWPKYKWKVYSGSTTLSWVHKWFHLFPSCLGVTADKPTSCRTSVSNRKAVYCCSVKVGDAQLIFLSSISICSPVVLWLQ